MPYTYLLIHLPSGKRYYGVRTAETLPPEEDLWKIYFSSSRVVQDLISTDGLNSFRVEIRKVFVDRHSAILWEHRVLTRIKAASREDWLNKSAGLAPPILTGESNGFYQKKHSQGTKRFISQKAKKRWSKKREEYLVTIRNRKPPTISDEERERMRERGYKTAIALGFYGRPGHLNPMLGKKHSGESRFKMSLAKKGTYDGDKNPMYGRKHNEESRAKMSKRKKGNVFICDRRDGRTKCIPITELESYLLAGWNRGRK
jgi:hypothetical protein